MKYVVVATVIAASLLGTSAVRAADSDDLKWVAQCTQDNANASVGADVVAKYCACMNSKMDNNETQSITQWEKSHTAERTACEAASGWK